MRHHNLLPSAFINNGWYHFKKFIWVNKNNRLFLCVALLGSLLQWILFKYIYPEASFIPDSHSFIYAAANNMDVNVLPIGYSKFLRLMHGFFKSAAPVTLFQYALVVLSCMVLFFSILYLYRPDKAAANAIFLFLVVNPLHLFLSNLITGDAICLSLQIVWVTQLLWILHKPSPIYILSNAILLPMLFLFSFQALYYPLIALVAFAISKQKLLLKICGIACGVALLIPLIVFTSEKNRKITGTAQVSTLAGWQTANNALYMLPFVGMKDHEIPQSCMELDKIVRAYFALVPDTVTPAQGAWYINSVQSPLKKYFDSKRTSSDPAEAYKNWGAVAPVYRAYGGHLIKQYPMSYAEYYLIPNAVNFMLPPLGELADNSKDSYHPSESLRWFGSADHKSSSSRKDLRWVLLFPYPVLFTVAHFCFLACAVWMFVQPKAKKPQDGLISALILVTAILIFNFLYSVITAPVNFREQVALLIICASFAILLMDRLKFLEAQR